MAFDAVLERFVKNSPVSVMARLVLQRAVSAEWMDSLFEAHRQQQYTRELLFSTVVELMSVVAMGLRPSLHAAAKASEVGSSVAALYEKVNRMEPGLVRALVRGSAQRLEPVVQPLRTGEQPWAEGYRVRSMDGNHLPASEKRLKPLREFRGAALPGHSLVVYAPEQGLVVDMVPCEDACARSGWLVAGLLTGLLTTAQRSRARFWRHQGPRDARAELRDALCTDGGSTPGLPALPPSAHLSQVINIYVRELSEVGTAEDVELLSDVLTVFRREVLALQRRRARRQGPARRVGCCRVFRPVLWLGPANDSSSSYWTTEAQTIPITYGTVSKTLTHTLIINRPSIKICLT